MMTTINKNISMSRWLQDNQWKLLPFLVFLLLHLARPWFIGIYHDDWAIFVEPSKLTDTDMRNHYFSSFKDRPLLGPLFYVISRYWGGRVEALVVLSSVMVGICAFALHSFLRRIEELADAGATGNGSALAVAAWIAIPWGLGYSVWPVSTITTMTSAICFLLSATFTVDSIKKGEPRYIAGAAAFLLASYAIYQSFYLAFLPVIACTLSFGPISKFHLRRAGIILLVLMVIQVLAVFHALGESGKSAAVNIVLVAANFAYYLPRAILQPFSWLWPLALILIAALLVTGSRAIDQIAGRERNYFFLGLLSCIFGVAVATIPFSVAGYHMQGVGTFSRTTVGTNIWVAVIILIIYVGGQKQAGCRKVQALLMLLVLSFVACYGWQLNGWTKSWKRQQEILANFPYEALRQMNKSSVLILDEPMYINGVEVFAAPWDISPAIFSGLYSALVLPELERPTIVPLYPDHMPTWDGRGKMILRPNMEFVATKVWVFTPKTGVLRELSQAGPVMPNHPVDPGK